MIARNPRQKCECGASYRYDVDFQEHKRLGCKVESGKGDSLAADPDESPIEAVDEVELPSAVEQELVAEVDAEQPRSKESKTRKK